LNETRSGDHEGHEGGGNSEPNGRSTFWAACTLMVMMMMIAMIVQFIFIVMIV
jgi:hypothetical protein